VSVDKRQAIRVGYSYMRMTSDDFAYEGMQTGSVNAVLPTSEQPFKYSVNVIGLSYVLTF
jgi:hypothetical protein